MDATYAFYLHLENLKNSMYRQLSGARQSSLFWPKFYYSWFYTDEKVLYNTLNLRQKLGLEITEGEITTYNKLRDQMEPRSPFQLSKKKVSKSIDGTHFSFDEIAWSRRNSSQLFLGSLLIASSARFLKLSRYWYFVSFAPALILAYSDRKFVPYAELENFYSYVYERRKAESLYKQGLDEEFAKLDKENYEKIKNELVRDNKTLYEVSQELDELYLQAAIKSDSQ